MPDGTEFHSRSGRLRVLHVDDDQAFLDLTVAFLDEELPGAEVTTVTRPGAALERLDEETFDCVVSDYEMPSRDGLALLESVRERHPDLPFLLYTGKGSESIASQAINAGVTGYLQKGGAEQHERLANRIEHAVTEYHARLDTERYSTVLQALGYPTYVVDARGRFAYVNEAFAALTGYDQAELVGEKPALVKSEESVRDANEALRSVVSSEGPATEQFEIEIETKGGERVPCKDHLAPLPFDERYRGCAGILRDITLQRRQREELVRQKERIAEVVSVASHDLRTPLTNAQTALELARETGDGDYFESLEAAHDRIDRMLDELLTLAREGQTVAATESVSLTTVADQAWDSVGTEPARLRVADEATVEADGDRLRRLLENLVQNAIRHGDAAATVTVGVTDDGFYVEDDGAGVPEEARESVFDPGFTTADDGTGFGLAIISRIADAHGWSVSLHESDDGGARFEFGGVGLTARDRTRDAAQALEQ